MRASRRPNPCGLLERQTWGGHRLRRLEPSWWVFSKSRFADAQMCVPCRRQLRRRNATTGTSRHSFSPDFHHTIMSRPSNPQAAALLDHVFSQTLNNIEFLASHNYISPVDATELSNRLTAAQNNRGDSVSSLANSIQALTVAPVPPAGPASGRRSVPPPPPRGVRQARAVWAYNEDGRVRATVLCTSQIPISYNVL